LAFFPAREVFDLLFYIEAFDFLYFANDCFIEQKEISSTGPALKESIVIFAIKTH